MEVPLAARNNRPSEKWLNKRGLDLTREEHLRQVCSQLGLATARLSISLLCYPWLVGDDSPHGLKRTKAIPSSHVQLKETDISFSVSILLVHFTSSPIV